MSDDPILSAALEYANQGLYVFPVRLGVRGNGKKDVRPIDDWDAASSRDPAVITGWFTNGWKGAALAVDTGKSGVVVADQDVSDGKNGPLEWERIGQRSEFRVRTPTGGLHDWFLADPEHPVTVDNAGAVADGVDVRGNGGFVFVPPTIDPRGGAWEWEDGEIPPFTELPTVPLVIPQRLSVAKEKTRPKPAQISDDPLFAPGPNFKKESAARDLLSKELEKFAALTEPGSARSHILAQRLGVLAGHGVDVFWTYEDALSTLLSACEANGFIAEHGQKYAEDQACRGLDYGLQEPWTRQAEDALEDVPEPAEDAVSALLSEMLTADQMQDRPAPQYLIKGLLNLDSEAWLIGEPGSKKSFVVLDMASHIVLGKEWRGRKVTQGPVVMIVAEGSGGMSTRVKAWQKEYGRIGEGLLMLPRPVQASNAGAWRVLAEACKRVGAVQIVIDTQARVTVGLKENDATDMGVYVEAVRIMRERTGACVFTIHHTGRNGGDARGSSAIDGAQGTELKVTSTGPYAGLLKVEKQKDMEMAPDIPLSFKRVTVGVDEDGDDITSLVLVEDSLFAMVASENEPEPWEINHGEAQVRLIKVLRDQGGSIGLSKSEARMSMIDRFYGGDPKRLPRSTWNTAWTKVLEKEDSEGERVAFNVSGEKYALNASVDLEKMS